MLPLGQNFVVGGDIQTKMIHDLLVVVMEYINQKKKKEQFWEWGSMLGS